MTKLPQSLDLALAHTATLGEGLLWHDGRWWWTDIEGAVLWAWRPGEPLPQSARLPDRLGSFAHCRSGRVLLGLAKRLALATLGEDAGLTSLETVAPVDAAEPRTRINDGRTDRAGHFVFGTINEDRDRHPRSTIGSFYQYSTRHGLRRLALPAVAIANSICFSLDGRTMYFCDTLTQRIQQCDYDADGAQVDRIRPFTTIEDRDAWPDGSVIDAEGCLWNAQWGAGRVVRYDPQGRLMSCHTAAAAQTTCPAIGGAHGDELLLTSARAELNREALAAQPLAGSLFRLRLPRALGVPDSLFQD
jgi:L-arabinonolactonase